MEARDPVAAAMLNAMPDLAKAEVLDVYSMVTILMAARDDEKFGTAIQGSQMQFSDDHVIAGLGIAAGEFVKMLAEMLGQSVDDVVRNTLAKRHPDPTDMEMWDMILRFVDLGELP